MDKENENKKVVQKEVITLVGHSGSISGIDSEEDEDTPNEGFSQRQQQPSLASVREPRACRAPQMFGYEECVAYALVGYGDELSSYREAIDDI